MYVAWVVVVVIGMASMDRLLGNSGDINPEHVGRVRVLVIGNSGGCCGSSEIRDTRRLCCDG